MQQIKRVVLVLTPMRGMVVALMLLAVPYPDLAQPARDTWYQLPPMSRQEAKMLNFGMPGGVRGLVNCRRVVDLRPWQESLLEVFAVRGCDFGARYA